MDQPLTKFVQKFAVNAVNKLNTLTNGNLINEREKTTNWMKRSVISKKKRTVTDWACPLR